jgi:hypothetical protein
MTTPAVTMRTSKHDDGDGDDDVAMDNEDYMDAVGLGFASPSDQRQQQQHHHHHHHHISNHSVQDLMQGMQPGYLSRNCVGSNDHDEIDDNNNNTNDTRSHYQPELIRGAIEGVSTVHAAASNCNEEAIQFQVDDCAAEEGKEEAMATRLAAQEAMVRAQAIIQKFGIRNSVTSANVGSGQFMWEQQQHNQQYSSGCSDDHDDCKRRRDICLEQERLRLEKALLHNWEYLAKREEQRLQHQLRLIDAAKQLEQEQVQRRVLHSKLLEQQHEQQKHRDGHLSSSQAGIGTAEQRNRKRMAHQQQLRQQQEQDCSSSLYLYNLSSTTAIDVIRNLFQSYGTIKRVHFYSNKATGLRKGDGLVTYETKNGKEISTDFLLSVCQQVSFCQYTCQYNVHLAAVPSRQLQ